MSESVDLELLLSYENLPLSGEGFVADPFLISEGKDYLFFEIWQDCDEEKTIGLAELSPRGEVFFRGKVLQKPSLQFSFPFLFRFEGEVYMLPEVSARRGRTPPLSTYRAVSFPDEWQHHQQLSVRGSDPVVFRHNDLWYLFCSDHSGVRCYFADDPVGGSWNPHPKNPVTCGNRFQRLAGRPTVLNGDLYLFYQDGRWHYGEGVRVCRVMKLTKEEFFQKESKDLSPVIHAQYDGSWCHLGMHHADWHEKRGEVIVDGRDSDERWHIGRATLGKKPRPLLPSPSDFSIKRTYRRSRRILVDLYRKIHWKLGNSWK